MNREHLLELEHNSRAIRNFHVPRLDMRANSDGDATTGFALRGYASITNVSYPMYGGPPYGWDEQISRGAFAKTLAEQADVQLLINHAGMPLARTKSGTLTLREDEVGLDAHAPNLDPTDPDVLSLAPKMQRGDLDEMSFAFRVVRQRWEDEHGEEADAMTAPRRRILEVNLDKGDVSVVNYGANPSTSAVMSRDLDRAFAELRAGRTLTPELRDTVTQWVTVVLEVDDSDDEPSQEVDQQQNAGMSPAEVRARIAAGRL